MKRVEWKLTFIMAPSQAKKLIKLNRFKKMLNWNRWKNNLIINKMKKLC